MKIKLALIVLSATLLAVLVAAHTLPSQLPAGGYDIVYNLQQLYYITVQPYL